ncbi:MAG TPA: DTW domain-containing protein [Opitutaceae bacterium]
MSRSVVLNGSPRCERCLLSPRWCICEAFAPLKLPIGVNVLIHQRESYRPTSTTRIIQRVIPAARVQVYQHDVPLRRDSFVNAEQPLWILHPQGEPIHDEPVPPHLEVLLLDGSWREAARMMHDVRSWGRLVNLPMTGPSRYWLRGQQSEGTYSTIEALLFVLQALGLHAEHAHLQQHFELQVYAGLRSRGDKASAERYIVDSPARHVFAELIAKLSVRRPRV